MTSFWYLASWVLCSTVAPAAAFYSPAIQSHFKGILNIQHIEKQRNNKKASMPLWDKVKKSGQKTKLKGEILLLEREANARKKLFGIEFFDLVTNDKNKLLGISAGTIFKGQREELKEPVERARDDIAGMQAQKDIHQKDLDVLEVKGAHTLPDQTVGEKVNKAGAVMSNAATATKLAGKKALIDREIKVRKEEFGLEVFEHFLKEEEKKEERKGGIKKKIAATMSSLSQQEKDIKACHEIAQMEVAAIQEKINSKKKQMGFLDSEETEPLNKY
jgi:hypothetical protein